MTKSRSIESSLTGFLVPVLLLSLALFTLTTTGLQQQQQQHENSDRTSRLGPLWLYQAGQQISSSSDSEAKQNRISAKLDELLSKRQGPTIKASSDYHDFQDIQLDESIEAWRVFHERTSEFAKNQAQIYEPELKRLLELTNASLACRSTLSRFFESIRRLDAWAIQIWSASGNFPPTGIFDGYFTDLGSYRGCVDIQRPANSSTAVRNNKTIDGEEKLEYAASYCLVGFRPVVPSRRRFHQIFVEEASNLTELFPKHDIFNQATHFAQYFHYLYWKMAICVPAECTAQDVQQVARMVGRQLALMPAPVRCITRAINERTRSELEKQAELSQIDDGNRPLMINFNPKLNQKQWIALIVICSFFSIVFLVTFWHGLEITRDILFTSKYSIVDSTGELDDSKNGEHQNGSSASGGAVAAAVRPVIHQTFTNKSSYSRRPNEEVSFKFWCFHYFSMITNGREFADTRVRSNEILCLHGFRVITMLWIVCVHTLQYNDWSGFSRDFENVASLRNPAVQPLINANYVVDNFFLMSGLLAAYTIWHNNKGMSNNFSAFKCLLGRYLRLTPQVLLISLAYMLLPLLGSGPFWHDMTHHAGKYCEQNWWVNLLHLQSFYREQEMCNLVGWWISVDMFYYVVALALLWMILNKRIKLAAVVTCVFLIYCTIITAWRHYSGGFTPNNLGSVPQIGEVWSEFVVKFFWSPYPHAFVFFLGLWLGYALANRHLYYFIRRHSKLGWILSSSSLIIVNYSTRIWISGTVDVAAGPQLVNTTFNIVSVIIWACAFGWMIVACHYGCAPTLNRVLSSEWSIMLSKASFIIYLSHMLIVRAFYGSQLNLLEVSIAMILILLVGMCFLSILFGVFLCIAFEGPCLKFQKFVLNCLKREQRQLPIAGSAYLYEEAIQIKERNNPNTNNNASGPTGAPLLK